nr:hypothetical protein [Sporichthya sp.]
LEGRSGARRADDPEAETTDLTELASRWRGMRVPAARDAVLDADRDAEMPAP